MRKNKINKLYHLSYVNHDGEVFKPRVPDNVIIGGFGCEQLEDNKTKRICFSKTISGAFLGINFTGMYEEMYVHVPENIDAIPDGKIIAPTNEQVWDAEFTREIWVKAPVKMKCIGKILVGYNLANTTWRQWRPSVKFRWLEKYV